jgi:hypothetical protein
MIERRRIGSGLIFGLGLITAVCGGVFAVAQTWPGLWSVDLIPSTSISEARARSASLDARPDLVRAEAETLRTLSQRPADAVAWARLAWIADQKADPAGMLLALERSYTVAPFGPEITRWRLRFAYDRWGRLTPELRQLASAELAMTSKTRPALVEDVVDEIDDASGLMAARLTLTRP